MDRLRSLGYTPQLFLLNAAFMGVPQARERVFFLAVRNDLKRPRIALDFKEPLIAAEDALADIPPELCKGRPLTDNLAGYWRRTRPGHSFKDAHPKGSYFNQRKFHPRRPAHTIPAAGNAYHWAEPRHFSRAETLRLSSFPDDYRTPRMTDGEATYVCGMSVPPRMVERVAREVRRQWLDPITK